MLKKILAALLMFCAAAAMAAVDVNKANETELDAIKGVGPITTKAILTERKKGDFKNWQDLIERVNGIGEARAARLSSEGLTVNGQGYKASTAKKEAKEAKKEAKADAPKPAASTKK
jgi:competence protein ComEA